MQLGVRLVLVDFVTRRPLLLFVSGCALVPESVSTATPITGNGHSNLAASFLLSVVLADIFEFYKLSVWL